MCEKAQSRERAYKGTRVGRPVWLECGGLREMRLEDFAKVTKQGFVGLRKEFHGNHKRT